MPPVNTGLEFHVDIGSAQNINSPIFLKAAEQSLARTRVPNKVNNTVIFNKLTVRKKLR